MTRGNINIAIEQIHFGSLDSEIVVRGNLHEQHLSYPTEMYLPMSSLNALISNIQKSTGRDDISEQFESYSTSGYQGNYYEINFLKSGMQAPFVMIEPETETIRQIRA